MDNATLAVKLELHVYKSLMRDQLLLKHLNRRGVDNWEWYGEAWLAYQEEARAWGLIKGGDDNE